MSVFASLRQQLQILLEDTGAVIRGQQVSEQVSKASDTHSGTL